MVTNVKLNHFNRNKPFYPLILHYIYLIHGLTELASRGVALKLQSLSDADKAKFVESYPTYSTLEVHPPTQLIGPISLRSQFQDNDIKVDSNELARDFVQNFDYILSFTLRAAGMLLILAFETTSEYHDKGPLWEFLRHCRNASAHNSLFTFKKDEPKRKAEWGRFSIVRTLQGTPLFINPNKPGLLSPGDPIRLLWDIEQAFPHMKA